ncbi:short-chain dehydrogenase [Mycolicibacterium conceptionense]|uniref:3-oxoacyl-[acyl-carrier-protein] reductase MabA n=1 Tax=Mycolicibacterium conceptionense TaxID=451644 RepID=A0A1A0PJ70_9MYCO|nr:MULTISPECIES: SDR family oxidoreductase [Mycolicibacterium]MCW1822501.1 SDR family oxidoreductase [Mycolicibacterium senegalense]OBB09752.1 short-chain dehydrogenase [Mycolicibacterium conceptionense]OBE96973.1 short-chain dehydrogenase [Mycolicibacterium conceptionense]OBF15255.1 short-chain dehydrogenase [Mycolicibacterium conceptionense]OBF34718.1 short-chain dehydrogenase [Mycolicibacterium conceptionense]
MSSLSGRVALVTGAAQGMGAAHARRLATAGATVAVNDIRGGTALEELATEIGGLAVPGDVSDPVACAEIADAVVSATGRLDVLVANHAYMTMAPLLEHDEADWWRVIDTNLGGTFHLVQAVLPHMRRNDGGRIVVIASEWGVTGWPEATAYAASKAGLISLVKTLGRELAPEGIIVNAVAPGVTDTPQLQVDADAAGVTLADMHARYAESIPLGRIGSVDEIAAAVQFLADFEMSAVVGQVISCNGGATRTRV